MDSKAKEIELMAKLEKEIDDNESQKNDLDEIKFDFAQEGAEEAVAAKVPAIDWNKKNE
jgi:hypothetical protein